MKPGDLLFPLLTNEETAPITYRVVCGDLNPGGIAFEYNFSEHALRSMFKQRAHDTLAHRDYEGPFLASMIHRHFDTILESRDWVCVTCDEPATDLLHCAMPLMSLTPERAAAAGLSDHESTVFGVAAPICSSGGLCDRVAAVMVYDWLNEAFNHGIKRTRTCNWCGKQSNIRLCDGCNFIGYCDEVCQARDWVYHRDPCHHAMEEMGIIQ